MRKKPTTPNAGTRSRRLKGDLVALSAADGVAELCEEEEELRILLLSGCEIVDDDAMGTVLESEVEGIVDKKDIKIGMSDDVAAVGETSAERSGRQYSVGRVGVGAVNVATPVCRFATLLVIAIGAGVIKG
jgi:hypothetical protein